MRLEQTLVGQPARQAAEMLPPFGPGFERRIIQQLESLKLMVSDFNDPAPDFCEWQALDSQGERIGTMRIRGY
jgi:hypothetical protein